MSEFLKSAMAFFSWMTGKNSKPIGKPSDFKWFPSNLKCSIGDGGLIHMNFHCIPSLKLKGPNTYLSKLRSQ